MTTPTVTLAGVPLAVDWQRYSRRTLPAQRASTDTTAEPGESALATYALWTRSGTDFSGGAGQETYDDPGSDRSRFWRSEGVDPWSRNRLSLLRRVESRTTESVAGGGPVAVLFGLAGGTRIVAHNIVAAANTVTYSDNLYAAGTPTLVALNSGTALRTQCSVTDGTIVYMPTAAGVARWSAPTNGAVAYLGTTSFALNYASLAGGRLFLVLSASGRVAEISTADGSTTTTLDGQVGVTSQIVEAGGHLFAPGAQRGTVRRILINASTGALVAQTVLATTLPGAAVVNDMIGVGNLLVIATSQGMRLAAVATDGTVTLGPVFGPEGVGAHRLCAFDRFVWWVDSAHAVPGAPSTVAQLYRCDLSRFVSPLSPAWATDVRWTKASGAHSVGNLFYDPSIGGLVILSPHSTALSGGQAVVVQDDQYVDSGWIDIGRITYGITATKGVRDFDLRHDRLGQGFAFTVEVQADDGARFTMGTSNTRFSTRPVQPMVLSGTVAGETIVPRISVTNSLSAATSPVLRRWAIRCRPAIPRSTEIIVPVLTSSHVQFETAADPHPFVQDPVAFIEQIERWISTGTPLLYVEGTRSWTVTVENYELPQGGATGWYTDGGGQPATPVGLIALTLVTLSDPAVVSQPGTFPVFGAAKFGFAKFGTPA